MKTPNKEKSADGFDVPHSELDAAVSYTPAVDLQSLLPKLIPRIHLGLLLPIGRVNGAAGAAAIAVEKVNADESLLSGYVLEYSWSDSGCSARKALTAMGELLRGNSRIDAVIGPGCSSACKVTSHLSAGQGIPQISHSCTSPDLSNKDEYELVRSVAKNFSCALLP